MQQEAFARTATNTERESLIVEEIMSSPVITASVNTSVRDVAKIMAKHNVDAVVIANKQREPVGIITEGDVVRRLVSARRNLLFVKAKHVMSRPVVTVAKHVRLEDAARKMGERGIKKLVVTDNGNGIAGVLTTEDIARNASYLIGVLEEVIKTGYVRPNAQLERI